jgi:hypothetical protein
MKFDRNIIITMQAAVVACIVLSGNSFGQPDTLWTRTYHPGITIGPESRMIRTHDGGIAFAGSHYDGHDYNWVLMKLDSSADREWSRIYASRDTIYYRHDILQGLALAPEGGFYLAGQWAHDTADYIMRIDAEGDRIWSRGFGFQGDGFYDVTSGHDGGAVIGGFTETFVEFGNLDASLIKLSPEGETIWRRAYGGRSAELFSRVISTSDGGYIAVGETFSFGGLKAYIVKVDSSGNEEWSRATSLNEHQSQTFVSVCESPEGGYLAVGSGTIGDRNARHYWVRFSTDGDILWSGYWDSVEDGTDQLIDATIAPNGGFFVVGSSEDLGYGAARLDANGDILWNLVIPRQGNGYYTYCSALTLEDGGYLIGGKNLVVNVGNQFWLIRTAPDPDFNSVVLLDPAFPSSIALYPPYPNPFNSSTTISYTLSRAGWTTMDVVDVHGRLVERLSGGWKAAGRYREVWNGSGWTSGQYIIRLNGNRETAALPVNLVK